MLDSGFHVLRGVVELKKLGVHNSALMKKIRHWPKSIPGGEIYLTSKDSVIGNVTETKGSIDGIVNQLFAIIDKDCVLKLMIVCGSLSVTNNANDFVRHISNELNNN